ncbi:MAG TPA: protein-S-isoprenylcysteine O-methyltransferase [Anaerolineales bacterium]|nr:protein-S-isoprenylcysteine O-methyltransferase [Anaerolineales bacterium]
MKMAPFTIIYFVAIVIEIGIRAPIRRAQRGDVKSERRVTTQEKVLLWLLWVAMLAVPVVYATSSWLDFANYSLPVWLGWLGVVVLAGALLIFWRAHVDLGLNWSPSLEIREKHELITHGIYGIVRHPMYASQWLWVIAQPLLLHNWIAGFLNLLVFIPFYFLRVKAEEQMMLDRFGEAYRTYMEKVGAVIPKF